MIVYDNSIRESIEIKNRFHSNMKDVQTSMQNIIIERNEDWKSMYHIYLKPERTWHAWFNSIITGEPYYTLIGQIEIHDNASVKIDVYRNNEAFDKIANYLDQGQFRVTVVDKTARIV